MTDPWTIRILSPRFWLHRKFYIFFVEGTSALSCKPLISVIVVAQTDTHTDTNEMVKNKSEECWSKQRNYGDLMIRQSAKESETKTHKIHCFGQIMYGR